MARRIVYSWFELRPTQNFLEKDQFQGIISKAPEFAVFFARHENRTVVFARIPRRHESLYRNLHEIQSLPASGVSFRFSHVARLKYFQHRFYLPFTTAKTYYQVFEALEQIQGDCIVAIYAKSNPAIRSKITAMINKKSQPGMTVSAQTKLNVDMAREKAKATSFFDADVFFLEPKTDRCFPSWRQDFREKYQGLFTYPSVNSRTPGSGSMQGSLNLKITR